MEGTGVKGSGGLHLNYDKSCELGMNPVMLKIFTEKGVRLLTASDAHCPGDAGANIAELKNSTRKFIQVK